MRTIYDHHSAYLPRMQTDRFFRDPATRIQLDDVWGKTNQLIEAEQLLRPDLWKRFVHQFREPDADFDQAWRGEFWGKMMRGACFVYANTRNPQLYGMLTDTVRDMLTTQDELGRISTYHVSHEFDGWDLWCRKYVLLGMQYFHEICEDDALKEEIIASMKLQADYILSKIGAKEGQKEINTATRNWRGLNSSSILEPMVRLYTLTKEQRYLDFASYIVERGGTEVANIFELAYQDELNPYQYPVTKAYEMVSCFEGLLEYYRITGIKKYKITVERFANRILKTDFTIIGSSGCTHELFDHSTARQANTTNGAICQETCVTVTLMKFFSQLLLLTGKEKYADAFERSSYNAYLGAINTEHALCRSIKERHPEIIHEPLLFDSYSPLTAGTRGNSIGGFQIMSDRHYGGCCACIGSTGAGMFGQMVCLTAKDGFVLNLFTKCTLTTHAPSGQAVHITMDTAYPRDGKIRIIIDMATPETYAIHLRIPEWSKITQLSVNDEEKEGDRGYVNLRRPWRGGDTILLNLDMRTAVIQPQSYRHDILMNRVVWRCDCIVPNYDREDPKYKRHFALRRGPLILAQDARLGYDLEQAANVLASGDGYIPFTAADHDARLPAHILSGRIPCSDGTDMPVMDYASSGKTWNADSKTAAWIFGDIVEAEDTVQRGVS